MGHDLYAGDTVHNDNGDIHDGQHHLRLMDEHIEAGCIDEVDLGLSPLGIGQPRRNRHLAGDFFFVVIGGGAAVIHAAQALARARSVKHRRDQRRLAGVAVSDHRHIPHIRAFIDFHGLAP